MATVPIPQIAGYRLDIAVSLADSSARKRLGPAGIKAFLRIAQRWGVKDQGARQLLGGVSSGSFYAMQKEPSRKISSKR